LGVGKVKPSEIQSDFFTEHGYLVIENFFDPKAIEAIRKKIQKIIQIVASVYGVDLPERDDFNSFTDLDLLCGADLATENRKALGDVYDAIKQIPEFMQLVTSESNFRLFSSLRGTSMPGLAANSYGIRIDLPGDSKYSTFWHQDFHSQLRSLNGVVFWTPVVRVTPDLGPVQILDKSHLLGPVATYDDNSDGRSGPYSLRLVGEPELVQRFQTVEPLLNIGDLLLMDFNLIHCSGVNASNRGRWSIQFRLFDYLDEVGQQILWTGSFASGVKFEKLFAHLKVNE
jgi:ectoine hydroxylase-related dioxygenase (phytanoyl-CoA dioxygenase family)